MYLKYISISTKHDSAISTSINEAKCLDLEGNQFSYIPFANAFELSHINVVKNIKVTIVV